MNLPHGSTPIGYPAVLDSNFTLERKFNFIYAKASNRKEETKAYKTFDKQAILAPKLLVPHWLLDNYHLSKQEKAIVILLLARKQGQEDSSSHQLARICKDSQSTISRTLKSAIDQEYLIKEHISNRVTHYKLNLIRFKETFMSQTQPISKLQDHIKIGHHGFYIHKLLAPKLFTP